MGKLFRNTLLFILGAVFLMSFTGLRLLLHNCLGCSTSEMNLFTVDKSCCSSIDQVVADESSCCSATDQLTSCCTDTEPGSDCSTCCEDKIIYLINDYDLLIAKSEINIGPQMVVLHAGQTELDRIASPIDESLPTNYYPPPPSYVGREFILFSHQIKIG